MKFMYASLHLIYLLFHNHTFSKNLLGSNNLFVAVVLLILVFEALFVINPGRHWVCGSQKILNHSSITGSIIWE